MDGIIAYILSKKYTNNTVIGMGAIKGAACQVQSINKVGKTTTVTLKWEDNTGGVHTQSFEIEDGADGVSVSNATINASGNLILTLSDGNTIDCGKVLPQYDTMPTPSSSNEGQILQYIGITTSDYTNGYFYECINDSGVYKWVEKLVQDSYTKSEIGNLNDLPDNTKNVVQNIGDLKLSIDQLSASKLSKTDIDNVLSTTSENPVQNKVITDALNDKENKFRVTLIPIASASDVGKIIQYIGSNTSSLTSGYYYQCVEVSTGVYNWVQKNVQPSNGGTGGDGVVDGYYNSTDQLFYEDIAHTNPISGDSNTLYVSVDTNLVYRFNGTIFIRVDEVVGEDDIINGYYNTTDGKFYEDSTYTIEITGETGKIYISIDTNIQYRWDNISTPNKFVPISATIDVDNDFSTTSTNPIQNRVITAKINDIDTLMASKVDKEIGKGLSANDYTNEDKQKVVDLAPIYLIGSGLTLDTTVGSPTYGKLQATGMSIPIDNELSETSINPVQNKVIALKINQLQGSVLDKIRKRLSAQEDNFAVWNNDGEIEDSGISKDIIPTTASASNKVLVKSDVDNTLSTTSENPVQNKEITVPLQALQGSVLDIKSDITDLQNDKQDKLTEGNGIDIDVNNNISLDISYLTASRIGYISNTEKGTTNGVAELDSTGKVPSSQLPSYIDDVIEGYYNETDGKFYEDSAYTTEIVGQSGVIYISVDTDIQYRWTGTAFAALGGALQLGETSSTAYRGDRGKIAYDHSQITNGSNPHNTTADNVNLKVPIPALSGSKLDVESTLYGINTELSKKADKVSGATNGHLAGLDSNGNLTDSGVLTSDVLVKSSTTGLVKNDGTIDTNSYATTTQLAEKTDKVDNATVDDFATLDINGNLTDSGINKNIIPNTATSSNKLATNNDLPTELNDLSDDVTVTSPTNGQVLKYNATSGKWENQTEQPPVSGATFKGSILFANIPTTGMENGDWYDIKDAFTTDTRFEEGAGIECTAGTDIIWVTDDSKWNILTPSGVNSFNGRVGAVVPASGDYDASDIDYDNTTSGLTATDVQSAIDENVSNLNSHINNTSNPHNVTKEQVGLGSVVNTGDSATPVSGGITKFTTGGAYVELNKKYDINDTAETSLADGDYIPFYDTSATGKKKTLWSNIKSVLKSYFDTLYATIANLDSWTTTYTLSEGATSRQFTELNSSYAYDVYFECASGYAPPTLTSPMIISGTTATAYFTAVTSSQAGSSGTSCKIKLRIVK